ncbi:uncharacterized protein LOC110988680 isoform X5 [Acanthaster planci]|uniref:Uncharacterized protein LOC110988680 isoform X5 n=1 Tax=Acanthaster planci TaxID=133434 RepID=A0A8B7ZX63_ACAPL|nr:uncharacterized protein LOC110988680 isoform X5 [Acanthaster planci]
MFWGLTIEPGKRYTQTVEESFHVSMVALDTRDVATTDREQAKLTQLMVQHERAEFLVCTLCYGTVFQQPLDLNFTEGEEVTFFSEGRGTLHLTGYLVKDEPMSLDPDMMALEEMSSSDEMASDSGEWASGEESSRESRVKVQRPQEWMLVARQGKKYNRNSRSGSRHRRFALVPRKTFPKKGNSWTQYPSRKKRTLSGIKSNNRWNKFSHKDRDQSIQRSGSAISRHGRQGYGLQEQRAILQTSDNVTATLILSESPCTMSSMSAAPTHQQGSIAPHQGQPGFVVSPLSSRLESRPCQDTVTYPTEHLAESFRTRTVVDGPNTLVRDPKAQLRSAHNWPGRQQASDRKVACPAPNDSERTPESPSAREAVSSNFTDILKTRIDQASPNTGKGYLKRKPPKSKSNASGTPKRFMSSAVTLPHRKIYHRKGPVTSRSQGRQLNIQWNESSPTSAAPTAGSSYSRPVFPDMVEECTTHEVANSLHVYDGASSQQGMSNNVDLQPSEQFPKVEDGIEPPGVDNSNSALVQITQPHPVPAEPSLALAPSPRRTTLRPASTVWCPPRWPWPAQEE